MYQKLWCDMIRGDALLCSFNSRHVIILYTIVYLVCFSFAFSNIRTQFVQKHLS